MLNHFRWFKLHNDQHDKLYTKHGTIWKKERFEMLPRLKNSWAVVVIWTPMLETYVLCSWYWWVIGEVQLTKAWKCPNRFSPLKGPWRNRTWNVVPTGIWRFTMLPNVGQVMKEPKDARALWEFWQKNAKVWKCKNERMRVFCSIEAAARVQLCRKVTIYLLFNIS